MRKLYVIAGLAGLLGAAACGSDVLTVPNNDSPDAGRVLANPGDVESLIAGTFNSVWQATVGGSLTSVNPAMMVMSFENSSSLANFNMGTWGSLPRNPIANRPGSVFAGQDFYNFQDLESAARSAAVGIGQLNKPGFTLGSTGADLRGRAFAFFVMGLANGTNALVYDSIPLVTQTNNPTGGIDVTPPLISHDSAIKLAFNQLDSAITAANAGMSDLPSSWIPGNPFTAGKFVQFIRSYKARLRVEEPRTPTARAAINWTAVRDDAINGITADVNMTMAPAKSWDYSWYPTHFLFDTWTQQSPIMIGMADSSGGYDAWLALPIANRARFLIRSADQRFPVGDTRPIQQANSKTSGVSIPPRANLYFRNRTASDPSGESYANSFYDWYREQVFTNGGRQGNFPMLQRAEVDLLAAEAYYRLGDFANAAARINVTRTANGNLPALLPVSGTMPGGVACVPRIPDPATNYTSSKCGDMFEALKWEKRMELAFMQFGAWYLDSRGWGDLAIGTATEWPVPFQEMQVRAEKYYDSQPNQIAAAKGTYGY
jgi:SusD family